MFEKIENLPDDYAPPVVSNRFRGHKKVLLRDHRGTWFGWEDKEGNLFAGALIKPSEERVKIKDEFGRKVEQRRSEVRQRKVTLDDLKRRRAAGEQMSAKDLNTLADLLLGRL